MSDIARCSWLWIARERAFSKVANAKPANRPKGCLKKSSDEWKAAYAPNNSMEIMTLKNESANCALKNGRTDPDEWFNELDTYKMRLGIMGFDIPDEDMIAHLMRKISSKEYDLVVTHMMTTMRTNPEQVTVANLKGAIRDRYKMMKLSGAIKKEPDEAFFTKKFKGTCNNCGKQGCRLLEQERL